MLSTFKSLSLFRSLRASVWVLAVTIKSNNSPCGSWDASGSVEDPVCSREGCVHGDWLKVQPSRFCDHSKSLTSLHSFPAASTVHEFTIGTPHV